MYCCCILWKCYASCILDVLRVIFDLHFLFRHIIYVPDYFNILLDCFDPFKDLLNVNTNSIQFNSTEVKEVIKILSLQGNILSYYWNIINTFYITDKKIPCVEKSRLINWSSSPIHIEWCYNSSFFSGIPQTK